MHWSEFIGGDVVISPPYAWQLRFNASGIEIKPRMQNAVDSKIIDELNNRFPDFRRAYGEGGLTAEKFDSFGATRRTLRQFIGACADLNAIVRDVMIPNPDS
jgi:transaldolase